MLTHRLFLVPMEHFDLKLTDSLSSFLDRRANLGKEIYRRGLRFCENIYMIGGHTLLSDKDLFGAVDDEVASRVIRTFVQIVKFPLSQVRQNAERRTEHYGELLKKF